jgi:hypothetical protein
MRPYPTDAEFTDAMSTAIGGITSGQFATKAEAHAAITMVDYALGQFVPDPTPIAGDHRQAVAHLQALQALQGGSVGGIDWKNLVVVLLALLQKYLGG